MTTLALLSDSISLAKALKASGLAGTGGQAKILVRDGTVIVNGQIERQPGRKLIAGDTFGLVGETEWVVAAAPE